MITKLLPNRPVIRETDVRNEESDPWIIELFPKWVEVRAKGKKARITLTYEDIVKLGRKVTWRKNA